MTRPRSRTEFNRVVMTDDEGYCDPPQQGIWPFGLVKKSTCKCSTTFPVFPVFPDNHPISPWEASKGLTRLLSMEHTPWTGSADLPNLAASARSL